MLDIGLGEVIVIAILALLVFGPDRLPKAAADAARALRSVREMATAARRELSDAAGIEKDDELAQTLRDIRDLDPRRALRGEGSGPNGSAKGRQKAPGAAGGSPSGGPPRAGSPSGAEAASSGLPAVPAAGSSPAELGATGLGAGGSSVAGLGTAGLPEPVAGQPPAPGPADVPAGGAPGPAGLPVAAVDPDWT